MATIKLVLDLRRKRKDNTYPLVFRLSHNSVTRDITTHVKLKMNQFNKASQTITNDIALSNDLNIRLFEYRKLLRECLIETPDCNTNELKNFLLKKKEKSMSISEFWLLEVERLKKIGRQNGARVYFEVYNAIKNEINLDVKFKSLNYTSLVELESSLLLRGMSINGLGVYMRTLRAICNKAIDNGLVDYSWYPYRNYQIRRVKTIPRTISLKEMKTYFNLNLSSCHPLYKSWRIGMAIFLLCGINLRDLMLLKPENIVEDRIIYRRSKTGKIYSIKISSALEKMICKNSFSIFDVIDEKALLNHKNPVLIYKQKTKNVNSHLAKIGELLGFKIKLTTYVFRYSYANIARELGFSKELIAEALGHQYGNSVTGIYLELFDLHRLDDMNSTISMAVLDF